MLRTAYWMSYFWYFLFTRFGKMKNANKIRLSGDKKQLDEYVAKYVKYWSRKLIKISGTEIIVTGEENIPEQYAVYVGNHQGNFDVPLMLGYVGAPRAFLAKIEMLDVPLVRDWMRNLGCIFVDRKDPKQSLKAVLSAIKYVKAGNSMTIFPEGTRSQSDKMGEFKSGSTRIAIKAGALIVPVTIDGSYKILEKNKGFKITPAVVKLTIHKPINPKELSKEEIENIDDIIKNIIQSKLGN